MHVLIACEESQRVCIEMRKLDHEAYSCDLLPAGGGKPEWHIQDDCLKYINGINTFTTQDGTSHTHTQYRWDLLICHPNCQFLCVTGNRWFNVEKYGEKAIQRQADRELAVEFFMKCVNADCDKIAIENPVGIMSTLYRKPDQIIQPWMFGDRARKKTCLWLKNLPLLVSTDIVDEGEIGNFGLSKSAGAYFCRDENGKILRYNDPLTAKIRSRTFPGIAKAFATQWAGECRDEIN